jgi:ABC-type phosphate transport system substrate-binding protein
MISQMLSRAAALVGLALALLGGSSRTLAAQEFKLVAHPSLAVDAIDAPTAQKVFLKQISKVSGAAVTPVDQAPAAAVREAFSKKVVGRPVGAVQQYWQQKIFSGGDVPPATKSSDRDVVEFVKNTPGAIGYVSASASTDGVKVLSLK